MVVSVWWPAAICLIYSLLLVVLDTVRDEDITAKVVIDRLHILDALVHMRELVTASVGAHDLTASCSLAIL